VPQPSAKPPGNPPRRSKQQLEELRENTSNRVNDFAEKFDYTHDELAKTLRMEDPYLSYRLRVVRGHRERKPELANTMDLLAVSSRLEDVLENVKDNIFSFAIAGSERSNYEEKKKDLRLTGSVSLDRLFFQVK